MPSHQTNPDKIPLFNAMRYAFATLEAGANNVTINTANVVANPSPNDAPANTDFGFDFIQFQATGGPAVDLTLTPPDGIPFSVYWNHGPTADNPQPHWYDFSYDGTTGAEFSQGQIVLHFVDGMRGDDDMTANGTISSVGGPGAPIQNATVSALKIGLNFAKPGSDQLTLSGTIQIPAGTILYLESIQFQIGDCVRSIQMDANGNSKEKDSTLQIKLSPAIGGSQTAAFTLKVTQASLAAGLQAYGLTGNTTISGQLRSIPVLIEFTGGHFVATAMVNYSASAGKSGTAQLLSASKSK